MLVAKGSTQKIGFRFITAVKGLKVGRLGDWRNGNDKVAHGANRNGVNVMSAVVITEITYC